jgi:membrane peptidoglycan carboxypeptidase
MVRAGFITSSQAAESGAQPLVLHPTSQPSGCTDIAGGRDDRGFFCDLVHTWWDSQPAFGASVAEREAALRRGGYTIVTSLDVGIQDAALHNVLSVYGYDNPRALPTAVVQPGTGRVLAMAVNRHYRVSATQPAARNYPDTVNQLIAGDDKLAGYPAGSTFKMFTMLAAVEAGLPLDTGFDAPSRLPTRWVDHGPGNCNGRYCPANANPQWMDGHRTMWDGFGRSVNTYWVWLEEQVGPAKAVAMAQRLGITFRAASDRNLADHQADSWGAFTLGVASTTPLDLANAYATVAADGRYCRPLPVLSITDAAGKAVSAAQPDCRQVIEPDVARAAVDAARCPVGQQSFYHRCDGGTAENVTQILGGRPVAGKTGSTDNNSTESFVGFTPQLAAAAIAANPDDPRDLVGAGVSPQVNAAVANTLAAASGNSRYADFTPPSTAVAFAAPFTSGRRSQAARRR